MNFAQQFLRQTNLVLHTEKHTNVESDTMFQKQSYCVQLTSELKIYKTKKLGRCGHQKSFFYVIELLCE